MSEEPAAPSPDMQLTIRVTAMPADTNPYGDMFGGWIMSQMDLGASSVASRHARGRAVTVAADAMVFHRPVSVGDEVSVYARLAKVGRTSMTVQVEAWRRGRNDEATYKVTEASFTFVALDDNREKRIVPPMPDGRG